MGNFWIAAGAVLPLMIYMGVGLLAKKRYGFTPQIISYFNKLVFGVFLPTNMFYSVYFTDVSKVVKPSFVGFAVAALLLEYLVGFVLVTTLVKDNKKRGAMIQAFYRSNFILLGVPLVENLYGAEAMALPLMLCEGRIGCAGGVGDYQIAPIAARSTAMGRWRLTPPGYGGTCLPAGRSAGLTRHRRVIQYRGPLKGKAWRLRAGVQRKFTVFLQNLKVELRKASML